VTFIRDGSSRQFDNPRSILISSDCVDTSYVEILLFLQVTCLTLNHVFKLSSKYIILY